VAVLPNLTFDNRDSRTIRPDAVYPRSSEGDRAAGRATVGTRIGRVCALTAVHVKVGNVRFAAVTGQTAPVARSEGEVQRALAPLQAEGWRLRHSLRWQGRGDIDSVAIASTGIGIVIETKCAARRAPLYPRLKDPCSAGRLRDPARRGRGRDGALRAKASPTQAERGRHDAVQRPVRRDVAYGRARHPVLFIPRSRAWRPTSCWSPTGTEC